MKEDRRHKLIVAQRCKSAAERLNKGLERARNPLVVFTYQDSYHRHGWPARVVRAYRDLERWHGPIGVAGVYGAVMDNRGPRWVGHVVDRDFCRHGDPAVPVATFDELLPVVTRRGTARLLLLRRRSLLGPSPARSSGVALSVLCLHNS